MLIVLRGLRQADGEAPHRALADAIVREVFGPSRRVEHREGCAPAIRGDGPVRFVSIARRGPWSVATMDSGPIGVDIEDRSRWYRFLDLWVAKEAVAKALGIARAVSPQQIIICWKNAAEFSGMCTFPCVGRLYYEQLSTPRWVVALANKT